MKNKISLLTILENTSLRHNLLALHGQSLLLNYFGNKYLFDVGEIFIGLKYNLKIMDINIDELKGIIISHKHADHCGALPELIKLLKNQKVYILPDVLTLEKAKKMEKIEKYRFFKQDEHGKYSLDLNKEKLILIKDYKSLVVVDKKLQIEDGLFLTGPLGDRVKEQTVVINLNKKGVVILTGCSHPTLPVIVKKAQEITGNQKVFGIIGGFHFKELEVAQLKKYIDFLKSLNLEFIVPSHCTGNRATIQLKKELGDKVIVSSTGSLGVGNSIQIFPQLKFNFV